MKEKQRDVYEKKGGKECQGKEKEIRRGESTGRANRYVAREDFGNGK